MSDHANVIGQAASPAETFLLEAMSPAFQDDPYPLFARMRRQAPVLQLAAGQWFVFGHDDVSSALPNPKLSSDERRSNMYDRIKLDQPDIAARMDKPVLLFMDPPDHTRLRRLVSRAFTPNVVANLRQTTIDLVRVHLDRLRDHGNVVDAMEHFAHPVPITIICALLGVPIADIAEFKRWSTVLTRGVDPGFLRNDELNEHIRLAGVELGDYLNDLANDRLRNPKDDLLSGLIEVEEQGDRISRAELLELVQLLLVAGHETTVNLIGNSLLALCSHRTERHRLVSDPTLVEPAIDEFMRYDSPVQMTQRIATETITLGSQTIEQGDQIVLLLGAANHDPAVFAQPELLDVTRDARRQVGFGGGIHHCLGASLARMEAAIAIPEFLARFPHYEMAGDPTRRPNFTLRGVSTLPLALA